MRDIREENKHLENVPASIAAIHRHSEVTSNLQTVNTQKQSSSTAVQAYLKISESF